MVSNGKKKKTQGEGIVGEGGGRDSEEKDKVRLKTFTDDGSNG